MDRSPIHQSIATTAFEHMARRGWTLSELAERSGLSYWTLYKLRRGQRQLGGSSIRGLLRAFPDLRYEDLFCTGVQETGSIGTESGTQKARPLS